MPSTPNAEYPDCTTCGRRLNHDDGFDGRGVQTQTGQIDDKCCARVKDAGGPLWTFHGRKRGARDTWSTSQRRGVAWTEHLARGDVATTLLEPPSARATTVETASPVLTPAAPRHARSI